MKGLMTKDFALFFQRKRTFAFLALWAVVMAATMEDGSFVVGWMTIIASFFAISSLTYDEYDNCMPFLMSLPINGKIYVKEKYLFGLICGLGAWIFAAAVYFIVAAVKRTGAGFGTDLVQMAVMIPISMILISISLPINLKFGSERGRMIILIIWGVVFVGIFASTKLMHISIPENAVSGTGLVIGSFAVAAVLTVVSAIISTGIMNKKEF